MFAIDKDRLHLLFTVDDRDLALAFAQMEGFEVRHWNRTPAAPLPIDFSTKQSHANGAVPQQIRPGVYAYRIARVSRTTDQDQALLALLSKRPGERATIYARELGLDARTVAAILVRLQRKNLAERVWIQLATSDSRARVWAPVGWSANAPPQSGVRFTGPRRRRTTAAEA